MTEKQRKYLIEVLPLAVICALMALFIAASALEYGRKSEQLPLLEGWEVSDAEVSEEDFVTRMTVALPESFDAAQSVCFFTVYQQVCVRLDGEEIYRFDVPAGEKLLGAAPSNWNSMALPEESGERTLTIELTTP